MRAVISAAKSLGRGNVSAYCSIFQPVGVRTNMPVPRLVPYFWLSNTSSNHATQRQSIAARLTCRSRTVYTHPLPLREQRFRVGAELGDGPTLAHISPDEHRIAGIQAEIRLAVGFRRSRVQTIEGAGDVPVRRRILLRRIPSRHISSRRQRRSVETGGAQDGGAQCQDGRHERAMRPKIDEIRQ